jgi:ureidoacrylate peracid hydrolase
MAHPAFPRKMRDDIHRRRGRPLDLPVIPARRAALLVVDMQEAFVAPGAPFATQAAREIVPAIGRLAEAIRVHGGIVVWISTILLPRDSPRHWTYAERFLPAERRQQVAEALTPGSPIFEIHAGFQREAGDFECLKDRFSPFSPGASDLDARLREMGIDTVIVCGTETDVCCESTARDAMMLNYSVNVAQDACAAASDEAHLRGLAGLAEVFATICDTDEIIEALR